jgi:hypothetical protein
MAAVGVVESGKFLSWGIQAGLLSKLLQTGAQMVSWRGLLAADTRVPPREKTLEDSTNGSMRSSRGPRELFQSSFGTGTKGQSEFRRFQYFPSLKFPSLLGSTTIFIWIGESSSMHRSSLMMNKKMNVWSEKDVSKSTVMSSASMPICYSYEIALNLLAQFGARSLVVWGSGPEISEETI